MRIDRPLGDDDLATFGRDGVVALRGAFDRATAARAVEELWTQLLERADDPATWTRPVTRIAGAASPAVVAAIGTARLCGAVDQLVGAGRWRRRTGYGSFPVRFPSEVDPGDAGWHIDGSFVHGDAPPPWNLWVDLRSRGRALLLLMLFTDVGPDDAPTHLLAGSHADVARALRDLGGAGSFADVTSAALPAAARRPTVAATGAAGDVFLCHPFLVHRATFPHRGTAPRFIAQPAIEFTPDADGYDLDEPAPVPTAVRHALRSSTSG